jgi:hypothetical protein
MVRESQFKEGELVDSIQDINQRELEIMFSILKNELKARYDSKSVDSCFQEQVRDEV